MVDSYNAQTIARPKPVRPFNSYSPATAPRSRQDCCTQMAKEGQNTAEIAGNPRGRAWDALKTTVRARCCFGIRERVLVECDMTFRDFSLIDQSRGGVRAGSRCFPGSRVANINPPERPVNPMVRDSAFVKRGGDQATYERIVLAEEESDKSCDILGLTEE